MPRMTTASSSFPPAAAAGATVWVSELTLTCFGTSTSAAHTAIEIDTSDSIGYPIRTFSRDCEMSLGEHFSSIVLEE